jgi:hypothetical protein
MAFLMVNFEKQKLDDGSREKTLVLHLQELGYKFMLPKDYFAMGASGKVALLIHDADFSLGGLETFMQIERDLGVRSAFYPRPDTEWFSQSVMRLQNVEVEGWEIGFQYDCLSRASENRSVAMDLFMGQLGYMRSLFNVSTTDYHGDSFDLSILNLDLYDAQVWGKLGLHEVYMLEGFSYFSDTNNVLVSPIEPLEDLLVVQLHTDWTK